MPAQDGFRRHKHDGGTPGEGRALGHTFEGRDDPGQRQLLPSSQARWRRLPALQDGELVPRGEDLEVLGGGGAAPGGQRGEEQGVEVREQEREHGQRLLEADNEHG